MEPNFHSENIPKQTKKICNKILCSGIIIYKYKSLCIQTFRVKKKHIHIYLHHVSHSMLLSSISAKILTKYLHLPPKHNKRLTYTHSTLNSKEHA